MGEAWNSLVDVICFEGVNLRIISVFCALVQRRGILAFVGEGVEYLDAQTFEVFDVASDNN